MDERTQRFTIQDDWGALLKWADRRCLSISPTTTIGYWSVSGIVRGQGIIMHPRVSSYERDCLKRTKFAGLRWERTEQGLEIVAHCEEDTHIRAFLLFVNAIKTQFGLDKSQDTTGDIKGDEGPRVPKRPKDRKKWQIVWQKIRGQWEREADYTKISRWLEKTQDEALCYSPDVVADIIQAGEAGKLD